VAECSCRFMRTDFRTKVYLPTHKSYTIVKFDWRLVTVCNIIESHRFTHDLLNHIDVLKFTAGFQVYRGRSIGWITLIWTQLRGKVDERTWRAYSNLTGVVRFRDSEIKLEKVVAILALNIYIFLYFIVEAI